MPQYSTLVQKRKHGLGKYVLAEEGGKASQSLKRRFQLPLGFFQDRERGARGVMLEAL